MEAGVDFDSVTLAQAWDSGKLSLLFIALSHAERNNETRIAKFGGRRMLPVMSRDPKEPGQRNAVHPASARNDGRARIRRRPAGFSASASAAPKWRVNASD